MKDPGANKKVANRKEIARFQAEFFNSNENLTSNIIYAFYYTDPSVKW